MLHSPILLTEERLVKYTEREKGYWSVKSIPALFLGPLEEMMMDHKEVESKIAIFFSSSIGNWEFA